MRMKEEWQTLYRNGHGIDWRMARCIIYAIRMCLELVANDFGEANIVVAVTVAVVFVRIIRLL